MKDEGIHRYNLKTDVDQPKQDLIVPAYQPTWDLNKNDPTKKRRLVKKFHVHFLIFLDVEKVYAGW